MNSKLYLKQLEVGPMQNFQYLIGDQEKKECVLIDPAWDIGSVLDVAKNDDMKVVGALITHTHYDHCNAAESFISNAGAKVHVHRAESEFLKGMQNEIVKTESGDRLSVGDVEITFVHTPGHTPGSQCFLVNLRGDPGKSVVSGDTLFINACGRCDLPGGDAEAMYESLQRLSKIGDDVTLLPGHNYADHPTSTIGKEKSSNPYYQCATLKDFLNLRV